MLEQSQPLKDVDQTTSQTCTRYLIEVTLGTLRLSHGVVKGPLDLTEESDGQQSRLYSYRNGEAFFSFPTDVGRSTFEIEDYGDSVTVYNYDLMGQRIGSHALANTGSDLVELRALHSALTQFNGVPVQD